MSKPTRLQRIYYGMKKRCYNPNEACYKYYGARGIKICDKWLLNGSRTFCEWALANGYKDNLTIDRINNNGDYCPENCRWVTMKEQSNNTRRNKIITVDGQSHTLSEWADITGINYGTLKSRAKRKISNFLSQELLSNHPIQKIAQFDFDGNLIKIWDSLIQIQKETNYDISTISRLCRHIIKDQCYTAYKSGWTYYPQETKWHYPLKKKSKD